MSSRLDSFTALREDELRNVHDLHCAIYPASLAFDRWRAKHTAPYDGKHTRMVQRFLCDDVLSGYLLITEPVDVQGTMWSKICEGSVVGERARLARAYQAMMRELMSVVSAEYLFAEVSVASRRFSAFLQEHEQWMPAQRSELEMLIPAFLSRYDVHIGEGDLPLISRDSSRDLYRAQPLVRKICE